MEERLSAGSPGAVVSDLSLRLKALRRERGLSLSDVSRGTGISTSFLSLIENGKSDITFSKLISLVRFYGISVTDLLPDGDQPPDPVVVRREHRRHVYSQGEGIDVFMLAPDANRAMMPVIEEYDPGGRMVEYSSHDGEEFLLVLDGTIELLMEGADPVVLRAGDSAYYRADRRHAFRNVGEGRSRLFAVVTPPFL